jgi:hypothetical protein
MNLTSTYWDTSINRISDIGLPITPVKRISVHFRVPSLLYGVAWLRLELSGLIFWGPERSFSNCDVSTLRSHAPNFRGSQINCLGRNCGELRWQQMGPQPIQPEHLWRSCAKCFLTASFPVLVSFHGQQNPQILVHVLSVGLSHLPP